MASTSSRLASALSDAAGLSVLQSTTCGWHLHWSGKGLPSTARPHPSVEGSELRDPLSADGGALPSAMAFFEDLQPAEPWWLLLKPAQDESEPSGFETQALVDDLRIAALSLPSPRLAAAVGLGTSISVFLQMDDADSPIPRLQLTPRSRNQTWRTEEENLFFRSSGFSERGAWVLSRHARRAGPWLRGVRCGAIFVHVPLHASAHEILEARRRFSGEPS